MEFFFLTHSQTFPDKDQNCHFFPDRENPNPCHKFPC